MHRLGLLLVALVALVAAPSAFAVYPIFFALQGAPGVSNAGGSLVYVAQPAGGSTVVSAQRRDGSTVKSLKIRGSYGVPTLATVSIAGGLSHDGRTLVLQATGLRSSMRFAVIRTKDMALQQTIALDTVAGVAHCVGLPWPQTDAQQQSIYQYRLRLQGETLQVDQGSGARYASIDRATWRVTQPQKP